MFRRNIRTRIPTIRKELQPETQLQKAKQRDSVSRQIRKEKFDSKRNTREIKITPGEKVLVKQDKNTVKPP